MTLKQSFAWWCFSNRGIDDDTLLREAASIGYDAVELIGEELFDKARSYGLMIASHGGHQSIAHGLNELSEHDRIEAEIRHNLTLAQNYEIPNLIAFSGERQEGMSEAEGIDNTVLGLRRVAKAAEDAGVSLILELLNSKVDHPGYQCDHTDWGVKVCERVGSPNVKLLYDIYHMQIMEGDIIRTIRQNHAHFGHYHTAGNPGRRDLDAAQEINYPPIFQAIAETGYTNYIGHEFIPKGNPLDALREAHQLCHSASE